MCLTCIQSDHSWSDFIFLLTLIVSVETKANATQTKYVFVLGCTATEQDCLTWDIDWKKLQGKTAETVFGRFVVLYVNCLSVCSQTHLCSVCYTVSIWYITSLTMALKVRYSLAIFVFRAGTSVFSAIHLWLRAPRRILELHGACLSCSVITRSLVAALPCKRSFTLPRRHETELHYDSSQPDTMQFLSCLNSTVEWWVFLPAVKF